MYLGGIQEHQRNIQWQTSIEANNDEGKILFKGNTEYLNQLVGPEGMIHYVPAGTDVHAAEHLSRVFLLSYYSDAENPKNGFVSLMLHTPFFTGIRESKELIHPEKPSPILVSPGYGLVHASLHIPDSDFSRSRFVSSTHLLSPEGYRGRYVPVHSYDIFHEAPNLYEKSMIGLKPVSLQNTDRDAYPFMTYHLKDNSVIMLHSDTARNWIR